MNSKNVKTILFIFSIMLTILACGLPASKDATEVPVTEAPATEVSATEIAATEAATQESVPADHPLLFNIKPFPLDCLISKADRWVILTPQM